MSICDDSQVTASQFYSALTWIYDQRNLNLATVCWNIQSKVNTLYSDYCGLSTQFSKWCVTTQRIITDIVVHLFFHTMSILLTAFYKKLYWNGSSILELLSDGTGTTYFIELSFYDQVNLSYANLHYYFNFSSEDFTTDPYYLSNISYNEEIDWADWNGEVIYYISYNIYKLDLKKLFDFTEGENTYNLIDALISVLKVSDNS